MSEEYSSAGILVLKGLDPVRKRPGMYVGDTDDGTGLHHMLWEVFSNSLDQFLAGKCTTISLIIHSDNSVEIIDDGEGIPLNDVDGKPFLEAFMTELHNTATFDGHSPHTHVGGPVGLGAAVVNALSNRVEINIYRDGYHWSQVYSNGEPSELLKNNETDRTGTSFRYFANESIFSNLNYNREEIEKRLCEISHLNRGLKIQFKFHDSNVVQFCSQNGIVDFLFGILEGEDDIISSVISGKGEHAGIAVDVVFCWHQNSNILRSFANQLCTADGGTHIEGVISGVALGLQKLYETNITYEELQKVVKKNLNAIVNVNVADPQFSGPTKDKLINPEVREAVKVITKEILTDFSLENPHELKLIITELIS